MATPPKRAKKRTQTSTANARARATVNPRAVVDWAQAYCEAIKITFGRIHASAKAAGISPCRVRARRATDEAFARMEAEALAVAQEGADDEARRRACEGVVTETVTTTKGGETVTRTKIEYSDTILLRLLERLETGSWRQKQQIEHSAPDAFQTRAERIAALEKARAEIAAAEKRGSAIAEREAL